MSDPKMVTEWRVTFSEFHVGASGLAEPSTYTVLGTATEVRDFVDRLSMNGGCATIDPPLPIEVYRAVGSVPLTEVER